MKTTTKKKVPSLGQTQVPFLQNLGRVALKMEKSQLQMADFGFTTV
jgi:hypothetical protein